MSKQLEKEYRSLMKEDAPDLWDRIEAGLEPKQRPAHKTGFWKKYRTWGAVAAACVCLMLAVPAGIRQMNGGKDNSADSTSFEGNMSGGAAEDGVSADSAMWDADQNMTNASVTAADEMGEGTEEQGAAGFTMTAKVLEMSETENRIAYTVQVEETECDGLSGGEQITLYDEKMLDVRMEEGETYRLTVTVRKEDNGTARYLLEDIDSK